MEINTPHPYSNLRVHRYAETFSEEIFWVTRSFPQSVHEGLTRALRESSDAIVHHVRLAWIHRFSGAAFRMHLDTADAACADVALQLTQALEQHFLPPDTYAHLSEGKALLHEMLHRLRDQRIALLA